MPPVIGALAPIALNLALGVGASVLSSLLAPKAKTPTTSINTSRGFSFEMAVGESTAVSAIFGLGRAKGQLVYLNEYGPNNDYLQMVIKVGHGWHDGMEAFLIDEKPVELDGSNAGALGRSVVPFTVGGTPYMWVKYYTGAPGQVADPQLIANSNPSGRWTSAHKMTGCAYIIITFRFNADLYGSSLPLSGSVWRGLRLLDWRVPGSVWGDQSTYVFTKNPAVIRYNFRRGIYVNGVKVLGQGFSAYANDLAGYTVAANLCDEDIYEPVSGTTFKRYEYGREVGDDEEKLGVLSELDDSYCGSSFKRGGADVPLPAQQLISAMTLRDGDRIVGQPVRVDRKGVVSSKRTAFHGQFVSKDVGWGLAPFTPRINTALESVLGGRRSIALDQPYEYLQERAQARAEIRLRRQFYPATRVETFGPKALALEPGDPITRDSADWGSMLMVVEKTEPLPNRMGAIITMTEWNNTIVPASGDTFVVLPSGPGAGPANPDRTIAVSGLSIVPFSRTGGGAVHPYGKATWTQITDPNVDQVMIRVWPTDGTEADDKEDFFADSKLTSTKLVGPLQPMTEYTYRAIPIRSDARLCVWTNPATFTTGEETTPSEIADGSIELIKLGQELRNAYGIVTDPSIGGSIPDQLNAIEQQSAALAAALMDVSATVKERIDILRTSLGGSNAAVIRTEKAIVEETKARATAITEVLASVGDVIADGFLRFEAVVDEDASTASITAKVKASSGATFSEAAWILQAEADGLGGTNSYFGVVGTLYVFSPDETIRTPVFTVSGAGVATMETVRAKTIYAGLLSSDDGEFLIDAKNKRVSIA